MNKQILNRWVSSLYGNKFKILGIIALISSGIGYYAYRNDLRQKKRKSQEQRKQQLVQVHNLNKQLTQQSKMVIQSADMMNNTNKNPATSIYSLYYFDKQLQLQLILSHFDRQGVSVQSIYKYSPLIAQQQYCSYTQQIKHRRRLIRPLNQDQYISLILQYEQQIQQLLQRSRHQILEQCSIDLQQFQKMQDMFQITEDITVLMMKAKKGLKEMVNERKIKEKYRKQ